MTQPQNQSPNEPPNEPRKKTRREMLEGFVATHPGDAFGLYGLALECAGQDDHAAAQQYFEKLLAAHPDYSAGYFQFGQMLGKLARVEEARRTLTTGIEAARRTGDHHAASEMEAALSLLPQS